MPARPPPPEPVDQRLFGAALILLVTLGLILFFHEIAQRPPGQSRIAWPSPTPAKP